MPTFIHFDSDELEGLNLLPSLNQAGAAVIVVSAYCTGAAKVVCQHSGIRGFVDKVYCPDGLLPTITTVLAGEQKFPPEWASINLTDLPRLTHSAIRLLKILVKHPAYTNEAIAKEVHRGPDTIKTHMSNLMRAFNCDSRFELINKVKRSGYITALELTKKRRK